MPAYEFKCMFCGDVKAYVFRRVEDRNKVEECTHCGERMERALNSTAKQKPFTPYFHQQLGETFSSRSEENKYAKKRGLVNISGDFGKKLVESTSHGKGKIK